MNIKEIQMIKNYNLKYNKTFVYDLFGNEYEIGYAIGTIFKKVLKKEIKKILSKVKYSIKDKQEQLTKIKNLLKDYPFVMESVSGRAAGAQIDIDDYLLYMCTEYTEQQQEHCTAIMVNTKNNKILAHNEDDFYTDKNCRIFRYNLSDGTKFIEINSVDCMEGATIHIGQNFAFTMQFMWLTDFNLNYMPVYFYTKILSNAKSADEFLQIIKTLPIASGAGFNLCDLKTKKFYYIEKMLNKHDIKQIDNAINIHTNHLKSDQLKNYNLPIDQLMPSNTLNRQMVAESLLNGRKDLTKEEVLQILTYYGSCNYNSVMTKQNCRCGAISMTFGTLIYDILANDAKFYIHNKQKSVINLTI